MKEVFTMWRYTKMVVLTALTAAVYAAILIPFKGLIIVPGLPRSVRPRPFPWSSDSCSAQPEPGARRSGT